jgi:hypothetical protein
VSGWHLLLTALALLLLFLFCPGRSAAEILPTSDVLVPYFEVDLDDPDMGSTTLFAIGNASPDAIDVLMTVHTNWGIPLLKIPLALTADEVRSFNLRDWIVRGELPDRHLTPEELAHVRAALGGRPSPKDGLYYGSEDAEEPGLALGYVTIHVTGSHRLDVLWGDYYLVDGRRGFFQAETLVDIDPVHGELPSTCKRHAVRFLNAGSLAHGTQLLIWTERHWLPSPTPHSPGIPVATDMAVFNEPGRHVEDRSLGLLPMQVVEVDDLDLLPYFGWLDIVTEEPSFITEHLHTTAMPSAALHAYCLPVETRAPGPAINLEKFVNGADADFPPGPTIPVGATVTWEFLVENVGTEPLTDVVVTDSSGATVSCPHTSLEPQEVMTCILGGTARACEQHNVGRVVAYGPGFTEVSDEDYAYYTGGHHASLGLEKRVDGQDADGPDTDQTPWPRIPTGQTIQWTFVVTNTGDVELTGVSVADDRGPTVSCPKEVLQPGEVMTCTASSLAEPGLHFNLATATGSPPCGPAVSQTDPAGYVGLILEPRIDLEKLVNEQDADVPPGPTVELGAALTWKFVVANAGDVPLSGVAVTDGTLGLVTCPKTELSMGESMTCTVSGTAQACQVSNVATASGTAPDGATVADEDPAWYFGQHHAALSLEKQIEEQDADTAPGPDLRTGSTAHWKFVVTNTGDVPLTGVAVTDDRLGTVSCPATALAPGASMTCTAASTALPGQYYNVGSAAGTPPCGPTVSASDPAQYYGRSPSISLQKLTNGLDADTPPGPSIAVGAPVLWTYVVTNTGDTALTAVSITDDKGMAVTCPQAELAPGESMTCTAAGTAVAGQYANTGTAKGTPSVGPDVTASDPSHYLGYQPLISLEKRVNGHDADNPPGPSFVVGTALTWTYLVENTGDVILSSVGVTDSDGFAVNCPQTVLAPEETMTCTASGTALAGQQANVGRATGTPQGGSPIWAEDPAYYYGELLGGQGCTPGYWKNHTDSWPPAGFSPNQSVDSVFPNVNTYYPELGNATLPEALSFGGGPGGEGAAEILLRAAVAAVLNASHPQVGYPRTAAGVISDVNAALLQTRDPMLALAAALDADNNLGCPLN